MKRSRLLLIMLAVSLMAGTLAVAQAVRPRGGDQPPTPRDPAPPAATGKPSTVPTGLVGQQATIVLKSGSELTADVIKNDGRNIVLDLGFTVVQVPVSEVSRVAGKGSTSAPATGPASKPSEKAGGWQLYRTAQLEKLTIEKAAQKYGEGVVMVSTPGGLGSGFVLDPDGYCVTNYHVITGETQIRVTVFRRSETGFEQKIFKKVRIIAMNPFVDLALLKIDDGDQPFKYVYLGDSDDLEAGQDVFAIGNPLGLTRTVSQGIVSTKNRNFEGQLYIQTTTSINPGNSGGPLFNLRGEVVGVTSMGYLHLGGLNFAIPTSTVKRFIDNRDAFAYDENNPNSGYRYLQPSGRIGKPGGPLSKVPDMAETPIPATSMPTTAP